jgi:hypothetical protein
VDFSILWREPPGLVKIQGHALNRGFTTLSVFTAESPTGQGAFTPFTLQVCHQLLYNGQDSK